MQTEILVTLVGLAVAGLAAVLLKRRRTELVVVGVLGGFWALSASVIVVMGSTPFATPFWSSSRPVIARKRLPKLMRDCRVTRVSRCSPPISRSAS